MPSISARSGRSQSMIGDLLLELGRDLQHRRQQDDVLLRLLQVVRQIAQLAHDRRVVDEGVEVAQHEQARALDAGDVIERLDRILARRRRGTRPAA